MKLQTKRSFVGIIAAVTLATVLVPTIGTAAVITDGVLNMRDRQNPYRNGSRERVFNVRMSAGQTYVIDLTSSAFDPYLFLEDSTGRLLRSNDDGGVGLNSRIVFTPTRSGTYRIVVSSYQANATGSFKLRISP